MKIKIKGREREEDGAVNLEDRAALVVGVLLGGKQVAVEGGDVENISETY